MTTVNHQSPLPTDMLASIDELELELRRLPGVRAVGFEADEDLVVITLEAFAPEPGREVTPAAEVVRIAAQHTAARIGVEINRRLAPTPVSAADAHIELDLRDSADETTGAASSERVRLLSVLAFADTNEVEVHLTHGDRRTIGRASMNEAPDAVVEATLQAAEELVPGLAVQNLWSHEFEASDQTGSVVTVSLIVDQGAQGRVRGYGIASGGGRLEASAKATLSALNRQIERLLPA